MRNASILLATPSGFGQAGLTSGRLRRAWRRQDAIAPLPGERAAARGDRVRGLCSSTVWLFNPLIPAFSPREKEARWRSSYLPAFLRGMRS